MYRTTTLEKQPIGGTIAVTTFGAAVLAVLVTAVLLFLEPKIHVLGALFMS